MDWNPDLKSNPATGFYKIQFQIRPCIICSIAMNWMKNLICFIKISNSNSFKTRGMALFLYYRQMQENILKNSNFLEENYKRLQHFLAFPQGWIESDLFIRIFRIFGFKIHFQSTLKKGFKIRHNPPKSDWNPDFFNPDLKSLKPC